MLHTNKIITPSTQNFTSIMRNSKESKAKNFYLPDDRTFVQQSASAKYIPALYWWQTAVKVQLMSCSGINSKKVEGQNLFYTGSLADDRTKVRLCKK